jgi:hypothetical protein
MKKISTKVRKKRRPREIGQTWLWDELENIVHFEKLENLSAFQNGLVFLGRIGKASLSEFPEIYEKVSEMMIERVIAIKQLIQSFK